MDAIILHRSFSALQRAEIAEMLLSISSMLLVLRFSALQRAEIAEIPIHIPQHCARLCVSVLFNEPKLLKFEKTELWSTAKISFSALQRAEIAEILSVFYVNQSHKKVSVLFNEPKLLKSHDPRKHARPYHPVSVLFNEPKLLKFESVIDPPAGIPVSVLFNEPKLLKWFLEANCDARRNPGFSALQRAEIAEIWEDQPQIAETISFQCSSTSRNC